MTDNNLKILRNVKKVHFIGIGGIGMSGIAEYLLKKGFYVSGSDSTPSNITGKLSEIGAEIFVGHSKNNMSENVNLVVYSAAIKADNPELLKAKKLGINTIKRARMLGEIVNDKILIAVSGTHGKTSTTAMISKILIDCGFDPTVFVGGAVDFLESGNSRIGDGKYAVVEADEYDRSFLTLKPDFAVITGIDLDHTDIYENLDDLKNAFKKFLSLGKKDFKVIGYGDDKNVVDLMNSVQNKNCFTYGFEAHNNYLISETDSSEKAVEFEINENHIELSIPGKHNILNASAAFIMSLLLDAGINCSVRSLKSFFGVKRRLELKYDENIRVYDDYAHHPTEIIYSFNAVRQIAKSRVVTVFQPHTYTRTRDFYRDFANALKNNDVTVLIDLYPAREKEIEGVSSKLIFDELKKMSKNEIYYLKGFDETLKKLSEIIRVNDTVIFQGAGDITDLCGLYVKNLKQQEN